MKSLRNKVVLSAIVLVFALVATIGSTYAWFTVSNVVTVNSFDVTVESSEALLMRVWRTGEAEVEDQVYGDYNYGAGGTAWTLNDFSNSLTVTDSDAYDTELAAARLSPVTVLDGETQDETDYQAIDLTNFRKPTGNFLTPDTNSGGDPGRELAAAPAANSETGSYVELKFWLLKPAGDNSNINLSYTVTDNEAGESWEEALWLGTYDGGTFVGSTRDTQYVFGQDLDLGFTWASAAVPGYSSVAALNSIEGTAANTALGTATGTTSSVITSLPTANVPQLISVFIWAEGWDADTTNDIMGATFSIELTFTLVA